MNKKAKFEMYLYLYGTLVLIGIIILYFAVKQFQVTKQLLGSGIHANATVVELLNVSDGEGNTFKPVFEFSDQENNKRIFVEKVSSNPANYKVGEKVEIIYDPNVKDKVKVNTYWGLYRWTIILLIIALPILVIGLGYFLYLMG